ncbi:MAG TPA: glycosyltransferase [Burkholderiales bacterium]|nr:glycosyltransferase [Burkholderiales bacterium]
MKFSVVIPTHNRLELLREAVETILRQDYPGWELVIFDNASSDDIGGYIASVSDQRIRYERSDDFLPVTDSWNRAINLASGDYVTVLGDDDGLTPGYFSKLNRIIEEFGSPDVLYSSIYQFWHPGVAPWERRGFVADVKNGFFFVGRKTPFLLAAEEAAKAVRGSIRLRRNFTFNQQAFCVLREFLERLRAEGQVFSAPFPDYFFANIAFAKARTIVVIPEPMSIAGVSKASYGFMLFNELEEQGAELLHTRLASDPLYSDIEKFLLPGPLYNTKYVITMEHVSRHVRDLLHCGVAYDRYRRLQIFRVLSANRGKIGRATPTGSLLWSRLNLFEKLLAFALSAVIRLSVSLGIYDNFVRRALGFLLGPYAYRHPKLIISRGRYTRLMQFFTDLQSGECASAAPASRHSLKVRER